MRILAVSVATPTIVRYRGKDVATGIHKEQVSGPQRVLRDNIEGDHQSDLRVHGGFDKAVYAFPREHYSYYEEFLGQTCFAFGYFGENLTTEGMLESEVRIGDRYQVGDVILEVSQPRSPCFKFGLKMGTPKAIKTCLSSGKTGFYLRVLREGSLQGGDIVKRLLTHSAAPTVEETHRLYYFDKQNISGLRTALQTQALAQVWKDEFAARLRTLDHSS